MKIKRLFISKPHENWMALEAEDGAFFLFNPIPYRKLEPSDLRSAPGYIAKGLRAEEANDYILKCYGLEKAAIL